MKQVLFYGLIISGIVYVSSASTIYAQKKGDDIWKQLPALQPAYPKDRVSAPIDPQKQDKSHINIRKFDSTAINSYLAQSEFAYDRPVITSESLIRRFERWLKNWLEDLLGTNENSDWIDNLFYALAVIIITFVIARLVGLQLQLFTRKKGQVLQEFIVGQENIYEIAFDQAIAKAEAQGDYRYAVRLYYLKLLKELTDSGYIRWEPQKTNMQYVQEMTSSPFGSDFAALTNSFSYCWYGHFEVTPMSYRTFKERQQAIISAIGKRQTAGV